MRLIWTTAAALGAAVSVSAQAPFLSLPLDCIPGDTCYIEDYVDRLPEGGVEDYACGIKTRDAHRGTDFALTSQALFADGVTVIAAAPGRVEAVRDGMADIPYTPETAASVEGRECGNAVRIRHENGLQTLYCHLRRGSVLVASGDTVARGQALGLVGMSGQSNYPHVHLSVLGPDGNIDPFDPDSPETCGPGGDTLWQDPLPYTPSGLFTAGFSNSVPGFEAVKSGDARRAQIPPSDPLVLYAHFFLAEDGDVLALQATGPKGEVFTRNEPLKDPRKSQFLAYGRKAPPGGWPPGTYTGRATLLREGHVLAVRFTSITVR